jgi:hypothetical protein
MIAAVHGASTPLDPGIAIKNVVHNAGEGLTPETVPAWLLEDEPTRVAVYRGLSELLLQQEPTGYDWRVAIQAVGIVAGKSNFGEQAFQSLWHFALNDKYFGSEKTIPPSKDPTVREAVTLAKEEVPFAIAMMVEVAKKSAQPGLAQDGESFLEHLSGEAEKKSLNSPARPGTLAANATAALGWIAAGR